MSTHIPTNMRGLGYVSPDRHPGIIEPDVVLAKMRELDTQNRTINQVVGEQTGVIADALGDAWIGQWAAYYGEWVLFFRENQGWFDRFSRATVEQLEQLINRSNTFEQRLRSAGVNPGTPGRGDVHGGEGLPAWQWALIVVGGIAATGITFWAVSRVLREGRLIAVGA